MQNVSNKIAEKIKTPVLGWINFFQKPWCVWDNVKKYYTSRRSQMTVQYGAGKVWFEWWMTKVKIQTPLIMLNTYCFSMVTMVTQTFLIVTLHVYCLSCKGICCGEKACYAFNHRSIWDMDLTVWKIQIMFFAQTKRQFCKTISVPGFILAWKFIIHSWENYIKLTL